MADITARYTHGALVTEILSGKDGDYNGTHARYPYWDAEQDRLISSPVDEPVLERFRQAQRIAESRARRRRNE